MYMFISSIVSILFWCMSSMVNVCFYPISSIFWCFPSVFSYMFMLISFIGRFLFWCVSSPIFQCFWFCGESAVKLMKAPGRPTMMIVRDVFEADPQGYFANLRGRR
ncbi:hypothetical protein LXL04_023236 [Taraxacum kok-saghyz]